jgi:CheY-like chemotaxis protein
VPDTLVGDPGRLRQVLVNLVGNAVKFTEAGEICVAVEGTMEEDRVRLHFQVLDWGIGVPVEKQRRIFEPFEQADGSTTRKFGGTGLGLAICGRLVALMDGRIRVESPRPGTSPARLGPGSIFHFEAVMREVRIHEPDGLSRATAGIRCLAVVHGEYAREGMTELFAAWGVDGEVVAPDTQVKVVVAAARESGRPFCVAILDVETPMKDQLTRLLRAAGIRVIALETPAVIPDASCPCLRADAVLLKPVKPSLARSTLLSAAAISTDVPPRPADGYAAGEHLRILLAEDNQVNQLVARRMLEKRGHTVTVVENGLAAVNALEDGEFDLVFMDVQMPEMDGLEATMEIRRRERGGRRVPIIAMTAHAMKGDREHCIAAGMDGYVAKPIQAEEVERAIAALALFSAPLAQPRV